MAISATRKKIKNKGALREERLVRAIRWSIVWLWVQGAVYTLSFKWLASLLYLRASYDSLPIIHMHGISLLALAFYISRALDNPQRQYLAVDTFLILFLGHSALLMGYIVDGTQANSDWVVLALNLFLAQEIFRNRVKPRDRVQETQIPQTEKPAAAVSSKDEAEKTEAPVSPPNSPPPPPPEPRGESDPEGKPISESLPRMD